MSWLSKRLCEPRMHWPTAAYALMGVVVLSFTLALVHLAIRRQERQSFVARLSALKAASVERLRATAATADRLATLFGSDNDVRPERFSALARQSLRDQPYLHSVAFFEWVEAKDRAAYERRMRARGNPEFRIHQGFVRGLAPAPERGEYLVNSYFEPLDADSRRGIGFDLMTLPLDRDSALSAIRSGNSIAVGPLRYLDKIEGYRVLRAVYARGQTPATERERREKIRGVASVTVLRQDIADRASIPNDVHIKMTGRLDGYAASTFAIEFNPAVHARAMLARLESREEFTLFGATVRLEVTRLVPWTLGRALVFTLIALAGLSLLSFALSRRLRRAARRPADARPGEVETSLRAS